MAALKLVWRKYSFIVFIAVGIGIMLFASMYYFSPMVRLALYGARLDHRVAMRRPESLLVCWHSRQESWTEYEGRLDTPLTNETLDEVSTIAIERNRGTATQNVLSIKPREWIRSIKNNAGFKNQTIPLNHPSLR